MDSSDLLKTLRDSFKDAQTVKSNLECVLNGKRSVRRDLEKVAEAESDALKQTELAYTKRREQCRVAQYKTSESQAILDSLEADVKEKKTQLTRVDDLIKAEMEELMNDVQVIEDELTSLTSMMMEAKNAYSDENTVRKSIKKLEKEYEQLVEEYEQLDEEEKMLANYLDDIEDRIDKYKAMEGFDRDVIWKMFENELHRRQGELNSLANQMSTPK